MSNKFDYKYNSFKKIISNKSSTQYYIKVDTKYISVSKKVYLVCIRSYWKQKNTYRKEVAKPVQFYGDMDFATSFYLKKDYETNLINRIYIKDLAKKAIEEINNLPKVDKKVAECIFIKNMSIRETSHFLNMSKSNVYYKKKKIQKILQKKLKF